MPFTYLRRAAVAVALVAAASCTVKNTEPPPITGPSGLALTLNLNAIPDSISQDGGSQSSVKVTAIGPDGRGQSGVPLRLDMVVSGVAQDYGTLSARSIVTNSDGIASVIYTAPPGPVNGVFGTCNSLPGNCVSIVATPTSTNFATANSQQVLIRLVPTGVILPPASAPAACFTMSPSAAAANITLQFTAGTLATVGSTSVCQPATSDITTFAWSFGDGSSASGRVVSHIFPVANTFNVTLTETNDRGVSGSTTQPVAVGGGALPTPLFTFSPASPGVNEAVFFNASTSTPGSGHSIASYRWTFGDGGTGSGVTVSHAFATAGTYAVQLTVTDEAGQSVTSPATSITPGNPPLPKADFTFSPSTPTVGQSVVFDWRTSTTAQGQSIVSLDWNFGDSTPIVHCPGDAACTSAGITTHAFPLVGTFVVNLVVTDSAGRTGTASKPVTVASGNPTAVLTLVKTGGTSIQADGSASSATGSSTISTYTFIWGDGSQNVSSTPVVSHTYAAPVAPATTSTFTVTLRVTDNANPSRTSTASQSITVP